MNCSQFDLRSRRTMFNISVFVCNCATFCAHAHSIFDVRCRNYCTHPSIHSALMHCTFYRGHHSDAYIYNAALASIWWSVDRDFARTTLSMTVMVSKTARFKTSHYYTHRWSNSIIFQTSILMEDFENYAVIISISKLFFIVYCLKKKISFFLSSEIIWFNTCSLLYYWNCWRPSFITFCLFQRINENNFISIY